MKPSIITPTHDPRWLPDTWRSLREQTIKNFEWVICVNGPNLNNHLVDIQNVVVGDPRVRVIVDERPHKGVGQRKQFAFMRGTGDFLVELDHDDLLLPTALEDLADAFSNRPDVGFVYSDHADFEDGRNRQDRRRSPQGLPVTYMTDMRPSWEQNGFQFYDKSLDGFRGGVYTCVRAFEPTAAALSLIFWAPNHVRAWRRSVYERLGGHNPDYVLADDHELLLRTYLDTKMHHIEKPLYLYRVSGENTWAKDVPQIRSLTLALRNEYLERLVLRQCDLLGLPAYDLGSGINPREGWLQVDKRWPKGEYHYPVSAVNADLEKRWPWGDGHVGAFRAHDLLEHLPDRLHTMKEIHRCLWAGGWLLSSTPSTDGRGAFQDPTHVSYWNENSFWYYTKAEQARFIETPVRFQAMHVATEFPSDWHRQHNIPYVRADLVALKDGYHGPGEVFI